MCTDQGVLGLLAGGCGVLVKGVDYVLKMGLSKDVENMHGEQRKLRKVRK